MFRNRSVIIITDTLYSVLVYTGNTRHSHSSLEIKVILRARLLAARRVLDDVLAVVHRGNLLGRGRVLGLLVVADADEAREPETDPLAGVDVSERGAVHGRDAEVRALHLPHLHGLEPVVGRQARVVVVVRLRLLREVVLEEGCVLGEVLVGEPSPDLADGLVLLVLRVVTREQETSVATNTNVETFSKTHSQTEMNI